MEYVRLESDTLADVDDSYYYGAYCRKCRHSARLSLVKLRAHLGDNFPLAKIRERLRCERCSSRAVVITFLAPNQRCGNVASLFGEPFGRIARSLTRSQVVPPPTPAPSSTS